MYLFTTTVEASRILLAVLHNAREERVNRWDAVTDGNWGSEIGQPGCAWTILTDITQHAGARGPDVTRAVDTDGPSACPDILSTRIWKERSQIIMTHIVVEFLSA